MSVYVDVAKMTTLNKEGIKYMLLLIRHSEWHIRESKFQKIIIFKKLNFTVRATGKMNTWTSFDGNIRNLNYILFDTV